MNFIQLTNVTEAGPGDVVYRVNIDHIVRYHRIEGDPKRRVGSYLLSTGDELPTRVAESPEEIDTLIQRQKELAYARSR